MRVDDKPANAHASSTCYPAPSPRTWTGGVNRRDNSIVYPFFVFVEISIPRWVKCIMKATMNGNKELGG